MNIKPYKFLCDSKVLCSIRNQPYMVVGSSVSRKMFDEVFLNRHIWSFDRQCHRARVAKFSWFAIIIWLLDRQHRGNVFTEFCWCTIICDEVWVLKEIEKHCFNDAENCIGNEEKEKHQKREIRSSQDAHAYSNYSTTNCLYVRVIEIL